jgi:hypothetical protein
MFEGHEQNVVPRVVDVTKYFEYGGSATVIVGGLIETGAEHSQYIGIDSFGGVDNL